MNDEPLRPTDGDRDAWHAYWRGRGMPWRTEPEIEEPRQRFLAERREVAPSVERGIYPFKGVTLTRADVEWLVARHDTKAPMPDGDGLILLYSAEPDGSSWVRRGPDLRGTDLRGANLAGMWLEDALLDEANLSAACLDSAMLDGATLTRANCAGVSLRGAHLDSSNLGASNLQQADLRSASLVQASLLRADLRRANLRAANFGMASMKHTNLAGADLRGALFANVEMEGADLRGTRLDRYATTILLGSSVLGYEPAHLPILEWTALPLSTLDWEEVFRLAESFVRLLQDILAGRTLTRLPASEDPEQELLKAYRQLARNYLDIAAIWTELGLAAPADRLRSRSAVMRDELRRRHADLGTDALAEPDPGAFRDGMPF